MPRFLIMEAYDPESLMENWKRFYTKGDTTVPFNFYLMEALAPDCGGHCIKEAVERVVRATAGSPVNKWMNWVVGPHTQVDPLWSHLAAVLVFS